MLTWFISPLHGFKIFTLLLICLLGFDTAFACYAANTCAKTIHFFTFHHGLKPVATNILSLKGQCFKLPF